jgi:hypothetical protein
VKPVLEIAPRDGEGPAAPAPRSRPSDAKETFARALDRARRAGGARGGKAEDEEGAAEGASSTANAPSIPNAATIEGKAVRPRPGEARPELVERGLRPATSPAIDAPAVSRGPAASRSRRVPTATPIPTPAATSTPTSTASPSSAPTARAAGHPHPELTGPSQSRAADATLSEAVLRLGRARLARAPERAARAAEPKPHPASAAPGAAPPPAPPAVPPPTPGAAQAAPIAEAARAAAPATLAPPLPIHDPRGDVSGAILPAAAHLRVSSDTFGELTLHLRVRDGAAHVRLEASAAAAAEARAPDLARALAAEGLALARLDVEPRPPAPVAAPPEAAGLRADADGGGRRQERPPRDDAPEPSPSPAQRPRRPRRGGHHVTA